MKDPTLLSKIIECKEKTSNDFVNLNNIPTNEELANSFNKMIEQQNNCLDLIKEASINVGSLESFNNALLKTTNRITVEQNILKALLKPVVDKKTSANDVGAGFFLNKIVKNQEVDAWNQYKQELIQEKQIVTTESASFDLLYIVIGFIVFIGVSRFVRTKILKKEKVDL